MVHFGRKFAPFLFLNDETFPVFIVHEKSVSVIYVYFTVPAEKRFRAHNLAAVWGLSVLFFGGGISPKIPGINTA